MDESLIEQKSFKNHWRKELVRSKTEIPVPRTVCFNWNVMFSPRVFQILSFVACFSSNFAKVIEFSSISAAFPVQGRSEVQIAALERRGVNQVNPMGFACPIKLITAERGGTKAAVADVFWLFITLILFLMALSNWIFFKTRFF